MTADRKIALWALSVGLIFMFVGLIQLLLHIGLANGQPLTLYAGAILTFAGLISTILNRRKQKD